MKTLISFLGRGTADKSTGYRKARYDFGNGFVREVPYFGLALTERLQPDRLVLVGTCGSMWDVFFEQQGAPDGELLALIDAVAQQRVDEAMLAGHGHRLAAKLGRPVDCLLIPYARDTAEQVQVLERLASVVRPHEEIVLDVTHAFRHLPMLALVAARYLTHIAQVRVCSIYYGALEMTERGGATPVLRLDGMLAMLDWVEALATYDKDGDYGVFASLLAKEDMPPDKAAQLRRAAFCERTSNPVMAREALTSAFKAVEQHAGALAKLFKPELMKRINWFRGQAREEWELSLADAYLERRDYLRAVIFLYEAFVTRAARARQVDHNDYQKREQAWKEAKQGSKPARKLEYLRNALTHGVKPDDAEIARLVNEEERLRNQLAAWRRELFA